MSARVRVRLDTKRLEELMRDVPDGVDVAVEKIAYDAVREAMLRAPVDTGALKNSLHVEPPTEKGKRIVSDGVEYGVYQEFGTVRTPAHPFMLPGVLAAAGDLAVEIAKVFDD